MNTTTEQEYRVLITQSPASNANGTHRWLATLLGFPFIVEEAVSRAQVIEKLKTRIANMALHTEIITLQAPALPIEENEIDPELAALGWDDYGQLKGDADALRMYDEIEQERDRHMVGGE